MTSTYESLNGRLTITHQEANAIAAEESTFSVEPRLCSDGRFREIIAMRFFGNEVASIQFDTAAGCPDPDLRNRWTLHIGRKAIFFRSEDAARERAITEFQEVYRNAHCPS